MSEYNFLGYEVRNRIAYIELRRPEVLNAFNNQMDAEIRDALLRFDLDDEAWVAILHGAGKAFCAGADLKSYTAFNVDKPESDRKALELEALRKGDTFGSMHLRGTGGEGYLGRTVNYKPVIGAVHGFCLGGAAHLAAECDLLVVSDDTRYAITETTRGMSGSRTWYKMRTFMPSKVGTELLITGRQATGEELFRYGLANRLAENGKHVEEAEALALQILKAPPLAVRDGVRVSRKLWVNGATDLDAQMQLTRLDLSEDYREAGRAFAEKRAPEFKAR
ncbi:enoyl-CoA hydratase/isomerase family protein [Sphingomonas sp. MG17]|uniref:Enoyl-CoA hydratase/isomerase family protein n=1 Tax=Sphingomonas tagetis TaxID=2949092 RepID=A0A9X2KKS3_9SPHN|nr:enoyl-CoA hydratase/isomerase family protein [Sphingomonas tagetis]MCP3730030.1 enoyl-CoA hydratase/isomerase family protein [Sphingomonas tagetis]